MPDFRFKQMSARVLRCTSVLANSSDPNEILQIFVFHQDLHCLSKYLLRGFQYSKTCLKRPLKNRQNKDLKDKW